ncbi:MgtC/SapB family protein [Salinirarus marinus]|uniref:MgtC/SapB family protein n=1 Tax=Salinirarus marinus TaxID=3068310 RepID=UPI003C6C93E3
MEIAASLVGIPAPIRPERVVQAHPNAAKLVFAAALGMLLGTEREWSQKPAGIRTFALVTTAAVTFVVVDAPLLPALGGAFVVVLGSILGVRGLASDDESDLLTTAISLVVAYGVGVLVGEGAFFEAVVVTFLVASLLVAGRELHAFAWNLSKDELRSAVEFGVVAFVVFPLLPDATLGPWGAINPRTVWTLVVAVSAIGFVNYLFVQRYGTRGVALTSFFGGLVNSTAVIGELASRTRDNASLARVGAGSILLADSAMALRDLVLVVAFVPALAFDVGIPLAAIALVGVVLSYLLSDWGADVDVDFESPFKVGNALKFGALFLAVLVVSAGAQQTFGSSGFVASSFLSGLLSSGAVTTSVVLLYGTDQLSRRVATAGVVSGVTASILVKLALAASMDRSLVRPVAIGSSSLVLAGLVAAATIHL